MKNYEFKYSTCFYSITLVFCFLACFSAHAQLRVTGLKTEYKINPIGIDANAPRLSWKLISPLRNVM